MAKVKAKKPITPRETKKPEEAKKYTPLSPKQVHELFGLPGPYEPPPAPISLVGYATFWDCGISIERLREKHRSLFYPTDFLDKARFAKDTDSWKWRQIRLTPIEPGKPFAEQQKKLTNADKPAAARELVTFLVLHFLTTGERLEIDRWRCLDVLPSKKRVIAGPFSDLGMDIGTVSDDWESPNIGLAAIFTPPRKA
ncbi:hypothetical protein [Gemmata sp.]|uniref:hypothetical protein n=1 Tax=Gemmata sp. TaxID=1914242 RepID=UPI003F6F31C4